MSSMLWWLATTIHGPRPTRSSPVTVDRQKGCPPIMPIPQSHLEMDAATRRSGSQGSAINCAGTATMRVKKVHTPNTSRLR